MRARSTSDRQPASQPASHHTIRHNHGQGLSGWLWAVCITSVPRRVPDFSKTTKGERLKGWMAATPQSCPSCVSLCLFVERSPELDPVPAFSSDTYRSTGPPGSPAPTLTRIPERSRPPFGTDLSRTCMRPPFPALPCLSLRPMKPLRFPTS